MAEMEVKNYQIFNDGIKSVQSLNEGLDTNKNNILESKTSLDNDAVFMGPICDSCLKGFSEAEAKIQAITEDFSIIATYLNNTSESYQKGDTDAQKTLDSSLQSTITPGTTTTLASESTDKKNINTSNLIQGSNVANAVSKYSQEISNAEYATINNNFFSTTSNETINGQPVKVTHVVINDGNQINGAPANGSYGNGLEKSSSAASRLNSNILINGSHFTTSGSEDLKGNNHVVIVNGQIKQDGTTGGQELLLDKRGNIYNASGKTAQQLVDDGVKYTFACHSTQVIQNGDTSASYLEPRQYKRTVIGQSSPGEYYIVTDTTYNNRLSDTAEYLKSKGCTNAYSLDQGGSVSLVRNNTLINNPSDSDGERAVGDFLYFTTT